jgi:hypothetical protein
MTDDSRRALFDDYQEDYCYDPMSGGLSGSSRRASSKLILSTTQEQVNQVQSGTIMFDQTDDTTQSV